MQVRERERENTLRLIAVTEELSKNKSSNKMPAALLLSLSPTQFALLSAAIPRRLRGIKLEDRHQTTASAALALVMQKLD